MNAGLVERWNSKVGPNDIVYHLGDFTFGNPTNTIEVAHQLNGQIHFVYGNHDHTMERVIRDYARKFPWSGAYKEIKINGQRIVMFHFPILSWHQAHRGAWHLHGHCHNNLRYRNGPMLDVGVDGHDFYPWSLDEVTAHMSERPEWTPVDHHDKPLPADTNWAR